MWKIMKRVVTLTRTTVLFLGPLLFELYRIAAADVDDNVIVTFDCKKWPTTVGPKAGTSGLSDNSGPSIDYIQIDESPGPRAYTDTPDTIKTIYILSDFHPDLYLASDQIFEEIKILEGKTSWIYHCRWNNLTKHVKLVDMAASLEKLAIHFHKWVYTGHPNVNFALAHFIGEGLGAHLWSYVGKLVQKERKVKVSRITGLDPIGVCFDKPYASKCGNKTFTGLQKTDATFVDVIFTGREYWGVCDTDVVKDAIAMCHACFFANEGYRQPGCEENKDGASIKEACSHLRAVELYVESINAPQSFNSTGCTTMSTMDIPCNRIFNYFGHNTDKDSEGIFGFVTYPNPPYSFPLICWPEAGSDDGKSTFQDCHISDHYIK